MILFKMSVQLSRELGDLHIDILAYIDSDSLGPYQKYTVTVYKGSQLYNPEMCSPEVEVH